jgi:hypothetical protein
LKPNLLHQIFALFNFTKKNNCLGINVNVPKLEDFETLGTRPVQGDVRNSQGDATLGTARVTLGTARAGDIRVRLG